jgi:hypothetical protein
MLSHVTTDFAIAQLQLLSTTTGGIGIQTAVSKRRIY